MGGFGQARPKNNNNGDGLHFSVLNETLFMTCPQCNTSKMRLRQAKANQNLFAGCSGFPGCKNIMNVPKGISNIHMLDQNCPRCMQRDKKEVKLFDVEFSKDVVN